MKYLITIFLAIGFYGLALAEQKTISYDNGSVYVGNVENGKRHGKGTMTYHDGMKYVGDWKDDIMHGKGTATNPDLGKYVGDFKDNTMYGKGTVTYPDGRQKDVYSINGELQP